MKWIGQHIYDFVSRFRSDVFVENTNKLYFRDTNSYLNSPTANDLEIVATDIVLDAATLIDLQQDTDVTGDLTVSGKLVMGSTDALTSAGLLSVANQTGVTGVGTISSGVWQGTTIKTAYIGDDQVTEDKLANTLLAEIDANTTKNTAPNVYGTTIKVLPSDFMANDEAGVGKSLQFVDNDASGIKPGSASIELLAFVCVPEGMKVTLVDVYAGSALAVDVIVVDINASVSDISAASIGSGNANTQINVTDTNSTATNYFMIQVTTTATSNRVYGALLTIAAQ